MNKMQKAVFQAAGIIAIAAVCGLVFNYFSPNRLDLLHFQPPETDSPENKARIIPLDMAAALFADKKAVFLDARPESFYAEGHIKGALSLPWDRVEDKFVDIADKLPEDKIIITYCDGMACELSADLADFLRKMGFNNVRMLINGWGQWKRNRLPAAEGDKPNGK